MAIAFHSDRALWHAFKKGNRDAVDSMFRIYYPVLYAYGLKMYGDAEFIEDSLQDFFLYLFEHRQTLSTPENVKAYLFKAYRRKLLRCIEKFRATAKRKGALSPNHIRHIQFSIDELIIQQEVVTLHREVLVEMLNKLPKRQREVIFLRYYNDLSIKDIAEVLSITYQGTVNTLYKAIKALRKDSNLQQILAFLGFLLLLLI